MPVDDAHCFARQSCKWMLVVIGAAVWLIPLTFAMVAVVIAAIVLLCCCSVNSSALLLVVLLVLLLPLQLFSSLSFHLCVLMVCRVSCCCYCMLFAMRCPLRVVQVFVWLGSGFGAVLVRC